MKNFPAAKLLAIVVFSRLKSDAQPSAELRGLPSQEPWGCDSWGMGKIQSRSSSFTAPGSWQFYEVSTSGKCLGTITYIDKPCEPALQTAWCAEAKSPRPGLRR